MINYIQLLIPQREIHLKKLLHYILCKSLKIFVSSFFIRWVHASYIYAIIKIKKLSIQIYRLCRVNKKYRLLNFMKNQAYNKDKKKSLRYIELQKPLEDARALRRRCYAKRATQTDIVLIQTIDWK